MENTLMLDVEKVKELWEDEESKIIFQSNIMYRLFGDVRAFENSNNYIFKRRNAGDFIEKLKNNDKSLVFFGAGVAGEVTLEYLRTLGIKGSYFVDNNQRRWGDELMGLLIKSPEEFVEDKNIGYVLVTPSSSRFCEEIIAQLINLGVDSNKILCPYKIFGKMYCDEEILSITDEDVMVDGGCYDGTSCIDVDSLIENGIKKIYAFEPDEKHYHKCEKFLKNNERAILIKKGLFDEDGTISFMSQDGEGSLICEDGEEKIDICKIDTEAGEATFIKMDIEGAELKALMGAKETIVQNKPKLAISIYHKPEDILQIPMYLKALVPEYKFYLRQYTMSYLECVLYATV